MNPGQELLDELFDENNLQIKLKKMIDLLSSFVVPGCFDHDTVHKCDLKGMIDKFIRMIMSPITLSLNVVGVSLFDHTVIPFTTREILNERCIDLCSYDQRE